MKKLQLEYLDLYLIHFPVATRHTGKSLLTLLNPYYMFNFNIFSEVTIPQHFNVGVGTTDSALDENGILDIDTTISLETTWHAMEELVSLGLVRSIGIR